MILSLKAFNEFFTKWCLYNGFELEETEIGVSVHCPGKSYIQVLKRTPKGYFDFDQKCPLWDLYRSMTILPGVLVNGNFVKVICPKAFSLGTSYRLLPSYTQSHRWSLFGYHIDNGLMIDRKLTSVGGNFMTNVFGDNYLEEYYRLFYTQKLLKKRFNQWNTKTS